jgi:hypothetical protein
MNFDNLFDLLVGDTSQDGHSKVNRYLFQWVGDMADLDYDSAGQAFENLFSLGRNIMALPKELLYEKYMPEAHYSKILEYAEQFDERLVERIKDECDIISGSVRLHEESYLMLMRAIATVGYGSSLPIKPVEIKSIDLGGYSILGD